MLQPARAYLYGRFQLKPESATQPHLFLQLTNMGTSEFMAIQFRNTPQQMYVVDVTPGQYEFTQLVSSSTMDTKVRTSNLRLPPRVSFMGQPFDVEAGKAYYVGDWFGEVSRDVDFYFVVSKIRVQWGLYQIIYNYEESTSALRHLYPNLGTIETQPAWGRRGEAPRTYDRAIPFRWQFAQVGDQAALDAVVKVHGGFVAYAPRGGAQ